MNIVETVSILVGSIILLGLFVPIAYEGVRSKSTSKQSRISVLNDKWQKLTVSVNWDKRYTSSGAKEDSVLFTTGGSTSVTTIYRDLWYRAVCPHLLYWCVLHLWADLWSTPAAQTYVWRLRIRSLTMPVLAVGRALPAFGGNVGINYALIGMQVI